MIPGRKKGEVWPAAIHPFPRAEKEKCAIMKKTDGKGGGEFPSPEGKTENEEKRGK